MKRSVFCLSTLCCFFMTATVFFTGCPAENQSSSGSQDSVGYQDTPASIREYTYGPNGKDDYSAMSSWEKRNMWNLANVHDPSVERWTDGYYYMYQTDASYGNAHSGKGHYYGRRSKDLVNWSYVGMAMPENGAKAWILEKVNEFRREMNLEPFSSINDISWGYWAPTVKKVTKSDGTVVMRMYYDVVIDNYIYSGKQNTKGNFDNSWTERAFIGMMESTDPAANKWEDKGYVLCSSSARGSNFPTMSGDTASSEAAYYRSSTGNWDAYFYFNAIDPTYIPGNHDESYTDTDYLIYGSWHHGFAGLEIDRDTGFPKATLKADKTNGIGLPWADSPEGLASNGYGTRVYCRGKSTNAWQPSEGPEVLYNKKDNYYYMFFANEELSYKYHTRVVRSKNPISGYKDIYGRDAINIGSGTGSCFPIVTHPYKFKNGGDGWVGLSHCTVFEKDGDWFYASQGRLPENAGGNAHSNAIMMGHVRKILWCPNGTDTADLWPIASPERYANIENKDAEITESDIAGKWEHINLVQPDKLGNNVMDVSKYVYFNKDKTVSGAFDGIWELDSVNKYLTVTLGSTKPNGISDSEIILVLDRELDWESAVDNNKRVATVVYAGISSAKGNSSPTTFWGKRVPSATE